MLRGRSLKRFPDKLDDSSQCILLNAVSDNAGGAVTRCHDEQIRAPCLIQHNEAHVLVRTDPGSASQLVITQIRITDN